jgi:hypothetical protein
VQDVELTIAVLEVELDLHPRCGVAVAHLGVRVFEATRKADAGPRRTAIKRADDGSADGLDQVPDLYLRRPGLDVDRKVEWAYSVSRTVTTVLL